MRYIVSILVLACGLLGVAQARADTRDTCQLLNMVRDLPKGLHDLRDGDGDGGAFRRRLLASERALRSQQRVAVFTTRELRSLRAFSADMRLRARDALAEQPPGAGAHVARVSLTRVNEIALKYGCAHQLSPDSEVGAKLGLPSPPVGILAAILLGLGLLCAGAYRTLRRQGRCRRKICRTTALLKYGENCTVTHVLDVSRRGAMLEAPEADLPKEGLTLYLAGHCIPARIAWSNHLFAGLAFDSPISAETEADILVASHAENELSEINRQAPDCFFPGCHEACARHRATKISLQHVIGQRGPPAP